MASTISGSTGVTADTLVSTGTGALTLPVGTTAQRPSTPATGMARFNSTLGIAEYYNGTSWIATGTPYLAQVLIVAGGGGSGGYGGAGGAGGVIQGSLTLVSGTNYAVTVGAGGAGAANRGVAASNGSNSTFAYAVAAGGGYGGSDNSNGAVQAFQSGQNGGSGGGASYVGTATAGTGNTPSVTPSQGFNGRLGGSSTNTFGGSGGGASAAGGVFTGPLTAGNGGDGISSTITGSAVSYGGGGGGLCSSALGLGGTGGAGGGGNGGKGGVGTAGTVNTGGGAGACWTDAGVSGGSGVVIISIQTAYYTGTTTGSPTVTTNGAYTVLKFNSSGSYTA